MTAAMIARAEQAVASVLRDIDGLLVSQGLLGVTVLLRGTPMVSISPVGGQYIVKTAKWLEARPPENESIVHVSSAREPDWQSFTTSRVSDVYRALHLCEPRLRHHSTLAERLERELDRQPRTALVPQSNPHYWELLATWAEVSGAMSRGRNVAKWARIYADRLAKGYEVSDRFAAWASRTAAKARANVFVPEDHKSTPRAGRGMGSTGSSESAAESSESAAETPANPCIEVPALGSLCSIVVALSPLQAQRLAEADGHRARDPLADVRARVIRAVDHDRRSATRQAVLAAVEGNAALLELPQASFLGPVLDAADALVAGSAISDADAEAMQSRWLAAISQP